MPPRRPPLPPRPRPRAAPPPRPVPAPQCAADRSRRVPGPAPTTTVPPAPAPTTTLAPTTTGATLDPVQLAELIDGLNAGPGAGGERLLGKCRRRPRRRAAVNRCPPPPLSWSRQRRPSSWLASADPTAAQQRFDQARVRIGQVPVALYVGEENPALEGQWPNLRLIHPPVHASWLDQDRDLLLRRARKSGQPQLLRPRRHRDPPGPLEKRYNKAAEPFDWRFDRHDLNKLLERIAAHEHPDPLPPSRLSVDPRRTSRVPVRAAETPNVGGGQVQPAGTIQRLLR